MADLVKVRASTEEQSMSAQTKELGRLRRRMDTAATKANRSVRVADLELALSEKTRLHEEELQQLRRASNVERANLLVLPICLSDGSSSSAGGSGGTTFLWADANLSGYQCRQPAAATHTSTNAGSSTSTSIGCGSTSGSG